MRKLIGTAVMALAVATTASATPVVAQPRPIIPVLGCTSEYVVKKGDNLWDLAALKLNNSYLWEFLVEQNPVLQEPGRYVRSGGKDIVLIYEGEKLFCLEDVGVNLAPVEVLAPGPLQTPLPAPPAVPEKTFIDFLGDWWWVLALTALGILAWLIYRESRKDPVNSGPPQVNGGVQNLEAARTRFESQSHQQHFTVLNVVPGTIYGTMMVRYGDGTERPRALNGERAYQATIRRADGQVDNIFMLQACGNDLRFGGVARYIPGPDFRFQPDTAEAPSPVATPAAETSSVADTSMPAALSKPELKIELKPAEREGEASMIRVKGAPTENMVVTVSEDEFTLRFYPPKKG